MHVRVHSTIHIHSMGEHSYVILFYFSIFLMADNIIYTSKICLWTFFKHFSQKSKIVEKREKLKINFLADLRPKIKFWSQHSHPQVLKFIKEWKKFFSNTWFRNWEPLCCSVAKIFISAISCSFYLIFGNNV